MTLWLSCFSEGTTYIRILVEEMAGMAIAVLLFGLLAPILAVGSLSKGIFSLAKNTYLSTEVSNLLLMKYIKSGSGAHGCQPCVLSV